jgi:hypothetical protein
MAALDAGQTTKHVLFAAFASAPGIGVVYGAAMQRLHSVRGWSAEVLLAAFAGVVVRAP